jgi:carbonic anhydrase
VTRHADSSPNEQSELDVMLAFNQARHAEPAPLPAAASRGLLLVACHDPRLTRLLPLALGIERGDAVLLRVPGAQVLPGSHDLLRAVAAAVYLNGCREVLALGHTDCAIHKVTVSAVLDAMNARGCSRDTLPNDVREFFGLRTDVRATTLETATAIRESHFLPPDLRVHAGVIDTATGHLTVIARDIARNPAHPAP